MSLPGSKHQSKSRDRGGKHPLISHFSRAHNRTWWKPLPNETKTKPQENISVCHLNRERPEQPKAQQEMYPKIRPTMAYAVSE